MSEVVTRFAPSPTGYLHIGGARTALFSWAWARQHGGRFLLRIEDTDGERSDAAHSDAIIRALDWLGITPDAPPVYQSRNIARHKQAVAQLLDSGRAYHCYCSPAELDAMRRAQAARGQAPRYDRRWRDNSAAAPAGVAPVVRFKMPIEGVTTFTDLIKGDLSINNSELDDFIIARSDGAPTYNLAAVVDDIDMGVTDIIRGDDHVMNTYRQYHVFRALTDQLPGLAHMPMILSAVVDELGAVVKDDSGVVRYTRMSKRHAAVDIDIYRRDGYLAEAMINYLAKLSWSHKDLEVFDRGVFVRHLSLAGITQSPARFDRDKLNWLNREYLRRLSAGEIKRLTGLALADEVIDLLGERAVTLNDFGAQSGYFVAAPAVAADLLGRYVGDDNRGALRALAGALAALGSWTPAEIAAVMKATAAAHQLPFKRVGMPMRVILTGETQTPDIARIAAILGKAETLHRLGPALP